MDDGKRPSNVNSEGQPQSLIESSIPPRVTKDIANPDQVLEAALQEAARAEAESSGQGESDVMDTEDFYGPETPNVASNVAPNDDEVQKRGVSPIAEDLAILSTKPDRQDVDNPLPILENLVAEEDESDDYEPAEAASPSAPFNIAVAELSNSIALFDDSEVRDEGEITDEAEFVPVANPEEMIMEKTGDSAVATSEVELAVDMAIDEDTNAESTQPQFIRKLSMSNDDIEAEDILPQPNGSSPVLTQVKISLSTPFVWCADDV